VIDGRLPTRAIQLPYRENVMRLARRRAGLRDVEVTSSAWHTDGFVTRMARVTKRSIFVHDVPRSRGVDSAHRTGLDAGPLSHRQQFEETACSLPPA
jgi:hypothetical protein